MPSSSSDDVGRELAHDLALVDDEDPVGQRADLLELERDEQDRRGRRRARSTRRRWTNSIAPTSRPRVGCAAIEHARVAGDLARDDALLLVAARQRRRPATAGRRRGRRTPLIRAPAALAHAVEQSRPCRDILGVLYSRSARFSARVKFRTRPRRWRSSAMWETPWRDHAARAGVGHVARRRRAIEPASTARRPVIASTSSLWPLPSTPASATISPACTVSEAPRTAGRPRSSRDLEVADLEHRLLGLRRRLVDAQQDLAADHQPRQRLLGRALGRHGVDPLAAPQHGDAVGDLEHLVELVRDEDDAGAVRLQRLEDAEEVARLLRGEHGGRLVEDEDPRAAVAARAGSPRAAACRR